MTTQQLDQPGRKHDSGKLRYDLVPKEFEEVVRVLTFGAQKYDDRNWESGINYGRCFAACLRHLWAWWGGEHRDPESGISHLAHAGCNILFLLAFTERKMTKFDDRPGVVQDSKTQQNQDVPL